MVHPRSIERALARKKKTLTHRHVAPPLPAHATEAYEELREHGVGIVYISHKMDELQQIADRVTVMRDGQVVGETVTAETSAPDLAKMMVGRDVLLRVEKPEAKPKPLPPLSLFAQPPALPDTRSELSKDYAPFGRLISCQLIITVDSSALDTPIIGLITEDVWHDGRLIVPVGTEVHGTARVDRMRERIARAS